MTAPGADDAAGDDLAAGRPSYEEARDALADIVRQLEAGGTTLEQSLALWERGEALAAICQEWLDGAQARLDEAIAERTSDKRES